MIIVVVGLCILVIALGFVGLVRGPHILDRVLSLDYLGVALLGVLVSISIVSDELMVLDVALTLALVGFVTALAFSTYLLKQKRSRRE